MAKKQSTYWMEFRLVWWDEIKSWFGRGSWRQTVTSLIITLGGPLLLLLGGKIDVVIDEAWLKIAALLTGVFWLLIITIGSYLHTNQVLYEKQKGIQDDQRKMIARLNKRIESKTIKTTEIIIAPKEEFPHGDGKEYYYAYLEIFNGEENDLLDCYANLLALKVRIKDSEEWGDYLDWVKGNTTELTWPKFDTAKDEKKVRRKNTERVNIAKWKVGGHPIFIFADGREEPMPEKQIYIEVSLNGEMRKNGKSAVIEEIIFCGFLKLKQGSYMLADEPTKELPYFRLYIEPGELRDE